MNDTDKAYSLWNKFEEYTSEEFKFLKKYIRNQNYKVSYGFYNKVSAKKKQITVVLDTMPFQMRRTGVENNWEIITTRSITDQEIEEYINQYYRSSFKRFLVFYYNNVDRLIHDDKKLQAVTPDNFIDQCRKKGYSGTFQLKIEYNTI